MYFEFVNKTKVCAGQNALSQLEYECQQYQYETSSDFNRPCFISTQIC